MKSRYAAILLAFCLFVSGKLPASPAAISAPEMFDFLKANPSTQRPARPAGIDVKKDTGIITTDSLPRLISRKFSFTEGPAADKEGNIFFTDQPNNKIWKFSIDEELSVFMDSAGRANGLYFDRQGNLLACADENNQLWSIGPDKKIKVLVDNYGGKHMNGPNDVWVSPRGGIYFTDPFYERPYWNNKRMELDGQKVYYLPAAGKKPVVFAEDLVQPNGIIGSPDGKSLFIADIGDGKTYRYEIKKDGKPGARTLFTTQGSDGMAIDDQGNIYLTGNGVTVFDRSGKQIAHIPIPEKWTGNVCFGGKNRNKLFITASEAVYILDMQVKAVD